MFKHFPQWRYFCKYIAVDSWDRFSIAWNTQRHKPPLWNMVRKLYPSVAYWWFIGLGVPFGFILRLTNRKDHMALQSPTKTATHVDVEFNKGAVFHGGSLAAKVYRQGLWMRHWGSDSTKRTNLWCNSSLVWELDLGKLSKEPNYMNQSIVQTMVFPHAPFWSKPRR